MTEMFTTLDEVMKSFKLDLTLLADNLNSFKHEYIVNNPQSDEDLKKVIEHVFSQSQYFQIIRENSLKDTILPFASISVFKNKFSLTLNFNGKSS